MLVGCIGSASESGLLETLFITNKYNNLARPVQKNNETINVHLEIVLRQIIQVVSRMKISHSLPIKI